MSEILSTAQLEALVKLCTEHSHNAQIRDICNTSTALALQKGGFIQIFWYLLGKKYHDSKSRIQPTSAGRAYVKLLQELEELKDKNNV